MHLEFLWGTWQNSTHTTQWSAVFTPLSILLQAVNYTRTLASPLSSKQTSSQPVGHFSRRRINLSPGANYSIVIPALNPEDMNSVVNVLFQVPTSAWVTVPVLCMCLYSVGECSLKLHCCWSVRVTWYSQFSSYFRAFVLQNHKYVTCLQWLCYVYVLALAHIAMPFWLCILHQVGSVCHLVQSDEPGIHTCSVDSLRRSVHLGLLNQIIGVRDLGLTHSLRFRAYWKEKPRNVTGCNIFSATVGFMLQNVFLLFFQLTGAVFLPFANDTTAWLYCILSQQSQSGCGVIWGESREPH